MRWLTLQYDEYQGVTIFEVGISEAYTGCVSVLSNLFGAKLRLTEGERQSKKYHEKHDMIGLIQFALGYIMFFR